MRSNAFSFFMAEIMTNDDWYALLKDLDMVEKDCAFGYLGSYHVDFPYILGLDAEDEAYFYLQKAKLYQGYDNEIRKGPLSVLMTNYMKGRQWTKLILQLNRQLALCNHKMQLEDPKWGGIMRQGYLVEYLQRQSGNKEELYKLFQNAKTKLWRKHENPKKFGADKDMDALADYLNARMDDNSWKSLIEDTIEIENKCQDYLGKDFVPTNWIFHAGITDQPYDAYFLNQAISEVGIKVHRICNAYECDLQS